jgi:NADH-quinone oxidoreductase subunit N
MLVADDIGTIMPQLVMIASAGLMLAIGAVVRAGSLWAPACLGVQIAAAVCLAFADSAGTTGSAATTEVAADGRTVLACWLTLGLGMLLTLAAWEVQKTSARAAAFFACLLLGLAGTMLVFVARDLIVLFLAVELASVSSGLLVLLAGSAESRTVEPEQFPAGAALADGGYQVAPEEAAVEEAALKHLLLGCIATALLLFGLAILYGLAGTTTLEGVRAALGVNDAPPRAQSTDANAARDRHASPDVAAGQVRSARQSHAALAAIVLVVAGLGVRMSVVPFHFGNADIFQGASNWTCGWLSTIPRAAAFAALVRLWTDTLAPSQPAAITLGLVVAGATVVVAGFAALREEKLRRIFAYTAASHVGFALIGIAVGCCEAANVEMAAPQVSGLPGGVAAGIFSLVVYLVAMAGLCAVLNYFAPRGGRIEYVDELAGAARSEPLAVGCALIFLLSLAGLPPLPGFWGRLFVLASAFSVQAEPLGSDVPGPHWGFVLLGIFGVLSVLLLAAVYVRILIVILLAPPVATPRPGGGQPALAAALLAAMLTAGVGLLPGPIVGAIMRAEQRPDTAFSPRTADGLRAVVVRSAGVQKRLPAQAAVELGADGPRSDP